MLDTVIQTFSSPETFLGSESSWFWTMAQAIVVTVSLILIYLQIRTQRISNSLATLKALGERWNSKRLCDARAAIVEAYPSTTIHIDHHAEAVLSFFEEIGTYVSKGVFDTKSVWDIYSYYIEHYIPMLSPNIDELRELEQDDSYYEFSKELYKKCCAISKKRGVITPKTETQVARFVEGEKKYVEYQRQFH